MVGHFDHLGLNGQIGGGLAGYGFDILAVRAARPKNFDG
jgi:hypothetical protein